MPLRNLAYLLLAATSALGASACSTVEVHTDHDPQADFGSYRTYSWARQPSNQAAADYSGVPNPLLEQRIHAAIASQLMRKGLRPAKPGEDADLKVSDHLTQRTVVEPGGPELGFGYGYGYSPWNSLGVSPFDYRQYTEGTLVIDLVDARTDALVWRGIATDAMEPPDGPEGSAQQVSEAVGKTFEKYPPGNPPTG